MNDDRKAWVTALEILSVLVILASVTAIAIPKYDDIRRGQTASTLLEDMDVLKKAVYAFYSDSAYFPPDSPTAAIPETLQPYLPRNFSSRRPYGSIEYKNWALRQSPDSTSAAPNVVGATVTTSDPRIAAAAVAKSLATARFIVGNKFTFLFFGS